MTLALTHAHGDRISVAHEAPGNDLFACVYGPEAAWEATKPYPHPVRTLSRLRVYDWPTVDGKPGGGTPHLHLICSEGYVVAAGRGAVPPLAEIQRAAADLVRPLVDAGERRLRDGAQAATSATAAHLAALRDKDERHLTEAQVAATGPTARGRFGMCGRLDVCPGI
ncbi:hypothetical protein AB0H03_08425 [Streptomyces sparsogenes]|uniref:hypothetical protein n=1 Tax=Streptomyces sparsogenes TaxID=67365 RepID=UPI0033CAA0DB